MSVGKIILREVDISYTEPESISKLRKEEYEKLNPKINVISYYQ